MSNSHLKTAHAWGVQKALEQAGYASTDDVLKEAQELGLVEAPKTAAAQTSNVDVAALFRALHK